MTELTACSGCYRMTESILKGERRICRMCRQDKTEGDLFQLEGVKE